MNISSSSRFRCANFRVMNPLHSFWILTAAVARPISPSVSTVSLVFFCSLCFSVFRMSLINFALNLPCLALSWICNSLIASSLTRPNCTIVA